MEKLESPEQVTEAFLKAIHDNFGDEYSGEQMDVLRLGTGLLMTSLARIRLASVKTMPEKILFQLEVLDTIRRLTSSLNDMLKELEGFKEGENEKV